MNLVILAAGLGTRMWPITGGRPKHFLEIGGMTILDRLVALAEYAGLDPVVVTRSEFAAEFQRVVPEILLEDHSAEMIVTLSNTRRHLSEPFAWVGGDMLFSDFAPVRDLLRQHSEQGSRCSLLYNRTDRFKAKLRFNPEPEVLLTREGTYPFSLLNFAVHSPGMFDYLPGDYSTPRGNFLQQAIDRGEPVLLREYAAPAFEIDTPADLAEARLYFEGVAQAS